MNIFNSLWFYSYYLIPIAVIWGIYLAIRTIRHKKSKLSRKQAVKSGMTEPPSLHPVIDHTLCLGCGYCINACPEQKSHQVLGLIAGKSNLITPAYCIGHGACERACPHKAITLVFGTEKRGIDIPEVKPNFETNQKGIYIAGELGGMGLIRNAIEQGKQAVESIKQANINNNNADGILDVLIVGAGPAGFAATLAAAQHRLNYITIEQDSLGGTVFHYPRGKVVMTAPVKLPLVGKVMFKETTKEKLLDFWKQAEEKSKVKIRYKERLESIIRTEYGFEVKTTQGMYQSRTVLLTLGRRGTPRKLGIQGEDKPKVVYSLIDPAEYQGKHVLVVGGGDSALEAAYCIACEPETVVTISYRSAAFSRAKEKNRQNIQRLQTEDRLKVIMSSNVVNITDTHVEIKQSERIIKLKNNAVIINAGGILPTGFLKKIGIMVQTKHGTP